MTMKVEVAGNGRQPGEGGKGVARHHDLEGEEGAASGALKRRSAAGATPASSSSRRPATVSL